MIQTWRGIWLGAVVLILLACPRTWATSVTYSTEPLSGGLFQYSLTFINIGGLEPLAGINILNGNSVFGLSPTSIITVPPDWDFFAPIPGLVNELNFFSLSTVADVPIGGSLGGFSFQSARDPSTIGGNDFLVEPVFSSSGQGPPFIATAVPEPATILLIGTGLTGFCVMKRKRAEAKKGDNILD